jgi:DNA replication protein DnaC
MIRHIRSAWRDRSVDEQSLITKYTSTSMLIIDEIGVQFGSDSEMVQMFEVMNKRYGEMLPTVLISNLQMDELCKLLGDRIIDRMREDDGIAVRMDWESNRSAS